MEKYEHEVQQAAARFETKVKRSKGALALLGTFAQGKAEVLLGPFWVWLFLGETASVNTLIGGIVLLAAIAGNALSGKRRRPPPITSP